MQKKRVVVIGAGPAGLTCALRLLEAGHGVDLVEASPYVGGLCRSIKLWDQIVDLGPHRFFSDDPEVVDFWKEIVGPDFILVDRLTRIYYGGRYFLYPLQGVDLLKNLALSKIILCGLSYMSEKVKPAKDPKSFKEWVVSRFGVRLYNIFFKTYTEKLWGISGDSIDADWASQRIKSLSVLEIIKSILGQKGRKSPRTLLDQFAYPNLGTGMLYDRVADRIKSLGGKIHLSAPAQEILLGENKKACGVKLKDGTILKGDQVVSTMPLTQMVNSIKGVPQKVFEACEKLYYRNTTLVYLEVDQDSLFKDNWIYVHSPDVTHGRITNFRNWSPEMHQGKKSSILCLEYWSFDKDALWKMTDAELGQVAGDEIRKLGLLPENSKILNSSVVRIKRSYPVYEKGYKETLKIIQDYLDSVPGLYAIGRYGAFKYNNQDHSIKMGILAAREIDTDTEQNLWNVNSDTEYQEKAEVSKKLSH